MKDASGNGANYRLHIAEFPKHSMPFGGDV
jgi:hypothetical protein